jgi:hypothetical protein
MRSTLHIRAGQCLGLAAVCLNGNRACRVEPAGVLCGADQASATPIDYTGTGLSYQVHSITQPWLLPLKLCCTCLMNS